MITQKELLVDTSNNLDIFKHRNEAIDYNGFKLYRSGSGIGTIIEFNFPNRNGGLGTNGFIEVIDAVYRNTGIAYAPNTAYDYDNSTLSNFATKGNDGSWYIYNKAAYDRTTAIPTNVTAFQNSGICSQWRNLYTDKTAAENTAAWMADDHFNLEGYAPYWTTHLDVDGGRWCIPNEFELIVIWCCSDKLDEMDPTFNSNKDKGLGVSATSGRWSLNPYIWSSTEYNSIYMRFVSSIGICDNGNGYKFGSDGIVPVREHDGMSYIYTKFYEQYGYLEFNGFKLYRSANNVATTIEYNWPTSSGGLGELRKMEVIDSQYRFMAAFCPSGDYDHDISSLTNRSVNNDADGNRYFYCNAAYSVKTAIPINIDGFTNSDICKKCRNLYSDKTAAQNTQILMNNSYHNKSGYAPAMTRAITADGGNWNIPNQFQTLVIYCCSDMLDILDPTFADNKSNGLGYTATSGRLRGGISSSTESTSHSMGGMSNNGCYGSGADKYQSGFITPIRELS